MRSLTGSFPGRVFVEPRESIAIASRRQLRSRVVPRVGGGAEAVDEKDRQLRGDRRRCAQQKANCDERARESQGLHVSDADQRRRCVFGRLACGVGLACHSGQRTKDAFVACRMVPEEGVEPTHSCLYGILSPARLPVPPLRPESFRISLRRSRRNDPQRPGRASKRLVAPGMWRNRR